MKRIYFTLPERLVLARPSVSAAGVAREVGEVALPKASATASCIGTSLRDLRFLIEQVGGAKGVYGQRALPDIPRQAYGGQCRRGARIVAFRASPVWVLAALADVCGIGRQLIPEIAEALKAQGLLEKDPSSLASIRCWTGWNGPRLASPRPSTRRRSTLRDFARNGRRFGKKPGGCLPPVFRPATRSATCGRNSRRNLRGRRGRSLKRLR